MKETQVAAEEHKASQETVPAGSALATGLVLVKVRQARNGLDDVCGLVHDDDCCRAQAGLGLLEGVKIHQHIVADLLRQAWH
jgi:hypothetical protein